MSAEPAHNETPEDAPAHPPSEPAPARAGDGRELALGMAGGVLAALGGGLLAWLVLHWTYPPFRMPPELATLGGMNVTPQQVAAQEAALDAVRQNNSIFGLMVLGIACGAALGIAEGLARRSAAAAAGIAVLAGVAGAMCGAAGGYLADLTYLAIRPPGEPLPLWGTMLEQAVALSFLAGGIGLALGLSLRQVGAVGRYLLSGLLAGVATALLFPVIVSLVFATGQTELVVPSQNVARLIWIGSFALLLGVVLTGTGQKRPIAPARSSAEAD